MKEIFCQECFREERNCICKKEKQERYPIEAIKLLEKYFPKDKSSKRGEAMAILGLAFIEGKKYIENEYPIESIKLIYANMRKKDKDKIIEYFRNQDTESKQRMKK